MPVPRPSSDFGITLTPNDLLAFEVTLRNYWNTDVDILKTLSSNSDEIPGLVATLFTSLGLESQPKSSASFDQLWTKWYGVTLDTVALLLTLADKMHDMAIAFSVLDATGSQQLKPK